MSTSHSSRPSLITASCPGGMARQFRVQVASTETPSKWKLVGAFRDQGQAGQCAARLQKAGHETRVVACSTLPTAA
jgi:hypothetical protein